MNIQETSFSSNYVNNSQETNQTNEWNGLKVSQLPSDNDLNATFEHSVAIQNQSNLTPNAAFADKIAVIVEGTASAETNSDGQTKVGGELSIGDKNNTGEWKIIGDANVTQDKNGNTSKEGKVEVKISKEF